MHYMNLSNENKLLSCCVQPKVIEDTFNKTEEVIGEVIGKGPQSPPSLPQESLPIRECHINCT